VTGDFPRAEGQRVDRDALPASVQDAIRYKLGARVVVSTTHVGGFSPGLAAHLETAGAGDIFVKAVSSEINPESPELYRREMRIASAFPDGAPVPRFRWTIEEGTWTVLAFDYIPGANPELPWKRDQLGVVLDGIHRLTEELTPSPIAVETAAEHVGDLLTKWKEFPGHPDAEQLPPAWRARLDELIDLESQWPSLAAGDTLCHLDIRADNAVLTDGGVAFVDWAWAATGAPWLDLVAFLPSVAMQGGPDPETLWRQHPLSEGVEPEAVDAFLAGLAGMFTRQSMLPPSPGVEAVRAFQAGQGKTARAWLAQRRGWAEALDG
jgi:hypothetical protein